MIITEFPVATPLAASSLGERCVSAVTALARRLRDRHRERKAIAELSGLSDAALKDMGVSRSLIPFVARDSIATGTEGARRR